MVDYSMREVTINRELQEMFREEARRAILLHQQAEHDFDTTFHNTTVMNPDIAADSLNLYYKLTYLLSDGFDVREDHIQSINDWGVITSFAVGRIDELVDTQQCHHQNVFHMLHLWQDSWSRLQQMNPSSGLMKSYAILRDEYYRAMVLEDRLAHYHETWTLAKFERMNIGKYSLAKMLPVLLNHFSRTPCDQTMKVLQRSLDMFACAYQMYDDLIDWHKDSQSDILTYYLWSAMEDRSLSEIREIMKLPKQELADFVFTQKHLITAFDHIFAYLYEANQILEGFELKDWKHYLRVIRMRWELLRRRMLRG